MRHRAFEVSLLRVYGGLIGEYLVTGLRDSLGGVAALVKDGQTVCGIDNFTSGKPSNLVGLESMEFIEGDLD